MSATPAIHDFFRFIKLYAPDGVTVQYTIEADSVTDTINLLSSPGISWNEVQDSSYDQIQLNVDYQLYVPPGTTILRLQDVNNNTKDITVTGGVGVNVYRRSETEIEIAGNAIAEIDTLHSVTNRGTITNNHLRLGELSVGTVDSQAGVDGFTNIDVRLSGVGTLTSPLIFQTSDRSTASASYSKTYTFSSVASDGVLNYVFSFRADANITSGSITFEREDPSNPGTWNVIDSVSGTVGDIVYQISGNYAESNTTNTNYRVAYAITGNTGTVQFQFQAGYEVLDIVENPVLVTNSAGGNIIVRDILPAANLQFDIGSSTNRFSNIYADNIIADFKGSFVADDSTVMIDGTDATIRGNVIPDRVIFETGASAQNPHITTDNVDLYIGNLSNDLNLESKAINITGAEALVNQSAGVISLTAGQSNQNTGNAIYDDGADILINGGSSNAGSGGDVKITGGVSGGKIYLQSDTIVSDGQTFTINSTSSAPSYIAKISRDAGSLTGRDKAALIVSDEFSGNAVVDFSDTTGGLYIEGGVTNIRKDSSNATLLSLYNERDAAAAIEFGNDGTFRTSLIGQDNNGDVFVSTGSPLNVRLHVQRDGGVGINNYGTSSPYQFDVNGFSRTLGLRTSGTTFIGDSALTAPDTFVRGPMIFTQHEEGGYPQNPTETDPNLFGKDGSINDFQSDSKPGNGSGFGFATSTQVASDPVFFWHQKANISLTGGGSNFKFQNRPSGLPDYINRADWLDSTIVVGWGSTEYDPTNQWGIIELGSVVNETGYDGAVDYLNNSFMGVYGRLCVANSADFLSGVTVNNDFTITDGSTTDVFVVESSTGNVTIGGDVTVDEDLAIGGITTLKGTIEEHTELFSSAGNVTHDFSQSSVFYHSSLSNNFSAQFTNVPESNGQTISVALILDQSGTAYMPTSASINGTPVTIKWAGGEIPLGNADQVDVVTFTFVRESGAWAHVLGSASTFSA